MVSHRIPARRAARLSALLGAISAAALLAACGSMGDGMAPRTATMPFAQGSLPASIQVPAGNRVAWETVGTGDITYECRDKAGAPAGAVAPTEWVFVGPEAVLRDRSGRQVGRYYGPPATWEASDGSKLTATQLAVAPSGPSSLPYQLVKANPATGAGALTGVTYIQRVALTGGVAPTAPCTAQTKGQRQTVKYQADYIFWKAA